MVIQNRELSVSDAIQQYYINREKSIKTLINIVEDSLPPCEVTFEDDIIYLLFSDDISSLDITDSLGIEDSYINCITPLSHKRYHFAIPLDFIKNEYMINNLRSFYEEVF